jgi:hypothetical protein
VQQVRELYFERRTIVAEIIVKPIEIVPSTVAVGDGPAPQTAQPVQRRIVGPLSPRPATKKLIAKPTVLEPGISVELGEIRRAWRTYRSTNSRDAVYIYLASVFAVVMRWRRLNCAVKKSKAALRVRHNPPQMKAEPLGIVIFCTADPETVDAKTRSKWSRVLRYAARAKPPGQRLADFVKSKGGLNECARKFGWMAR